VVQEFVFGQDLRRGLLEGARFRDDALADPAEKIPRAVPDAHVVGAKLGRLRARGVAAQRLCDGDIQIVEAGHAQVVATNLSNQPMQRLLTRLGWQSAGIVYGLDEGDPELFFLAPTSSMSA
jgi:hypothetical protein